MPSDIGPFLAAGALGAFWFGGNVVNHLVATANVNDASDELVQIPAFLSINVPGYGESPETIKTCLESIYSQNVLREHPDSFEVVYLATKTDPSLGPALQVVQEYTDKIVVAPVRGKLLARDLGLKASKGPMIVSVDSDSWYPTNWLNMMLKPYAQKGVVATTGSTDTGWLMEFLTNMYRNFIYDANTITARTSTFWKAAYFDTGGFDLSVEQNYTPDKLDALWQEEELFFKQRMDKLGKVVFVNAPAQHVYEYNKPKDRGLHSELAAYSKFS